MIVRAIVMTVLAGCTVCAWSSELCPPAHLHKEWSAQCFDVSGTTRRVKPAYLGNLDVRGLEAAVIVIADPHELVAVDREGNVLVPGIRHGGDYDYPDLPRGIGRFDLIIDNADGNRFSRCGYFRADRFQVIAAGFDHCQPFKTDRALACTACASYCTEPDCQDSVLVGGRGVMLDPHGNAQKSYALPTLETICRKPQLARISKLENGAAMLTCRKDSTDPFGEL